MIEVLNKYKEASKAIINKKMKDKLNLLFNQILYINGPIVVDAIKKSNSKTIMNSMWALWLYFKFDIFFLAKVCAYSNILILFRVARILTGKK